jgi:hypothetical protein
VEGERENQIQTNKEKVTKERVREVLLMTLKRVAYPVELGIKKLS